MVICIIGILFTFFNLLNSKFSPKFDFELLKIFLVTIPPIYFIIGEIYSESIKINDPYKNVSIPIKKPIFFAFRNTLFANFVFASILIISYLNPTSIQILAVIDVKSILYINLFSFLLFNLSLLLNNLLILKIKLPILRIIIFYFLSFILFSLFRNNLINYLFKFISAINSVNIFYKVILLVITLCIFELLLYKTFHARISKQKNESEVRIIYNNNLLMLLILHLVRESSVLQNIVLAVILIIIGLLLYVLNITELFNYAGFSFTSGLFIIMLLLGILPSITDQFKTYIKTYKKIIELNFFTGMISIFIFSILYLVATIFSGYSSNFHEQFFSYFINIPIYLLITGIFKLKNTWVSYIVIYLSGILIQNTFTKELSQMNSYTYIFQYIILLIFIALTIVSISIKDYIYESKKNT